MNDMDDDQLLRRQRHFLAELEREIRSVNRQIIRERIPTLSRQCFVDLGRVVAERRAEYLRKAIELSRSAPGSAAQAAALAAVPDLRHDYDESREAFAALERAIERGYIDIG